MKHGFIGERALIAMILISSCYWKTLVHFCLRKKKTEKTFLTLNSELSQCCTEKKLMPPKTRINLLFSDVWCYFFIPCFDCKIGVFQQAVVTVCYILNFSLPQSLCHGQYWSILPYFAFQHWCVLPLVILGFPQLILVYFSFSCCYQLLSVLLG